MASDYRSCCRSRPIIHILPHKAGLSLFLCHSPSCTIAEQQMARVCGRSHGASFSAYFKMNPPTKHRSRPSFTLIVHSNTARQQKLTHAPLCNTAALHFAWDFISFLSSSAQTQWRRSCKLRKQHEKCNWTFISKRSNRNIEDLMRKNTLLSLHWVEVSICKKRLKAK
jgi:hypothetical protein